MAQRIASELAVLVWSVQEKGAYRSTLRRYSIGSDDDVNRMMVAMERRYVAFLIRTKNKSC
jgi:hypothetical protein